MGPPDPGHCPVGRGSRRCFLPSEGPGAAKSNSRWARDRGGAENRTPARRASTSSTDRLVDRAQPGLTTKPEGPGCPVGPRTMGVATARAGPSGRRTTRGGAGCGRLCSPCGSLTLLASADRRCRPAWLYPAPGPRRAGLLLPTPAPRAFWKDERTLPCAACPPVGTTGGRKPAPLGNRSYRTAGFLPPIWEARRCAVTGSVLQTTNQGAERCLPPKRYVQVLSVVPVNLTLFGNRVLPDVMELR